MPTNLNIDDKLLKTAFNLGNFKSKKETVNVALQEYIQRHRQKEILKYMGKVDFDDSFDYKKNRENLIA